MSSKNTVIDRRHFVQGSALFAGVAAIGATAGISSSAYADETAEPIWDKEADVVVVGSGTATVAALAAVEYGAESVVLLEKAAMFGGTTAMSGQGMGIPLNHIHAETGIEDSLEDVLEYYKTASGGRADLTVGESYATNGDKFLTWLEDTYEAEFGFTMGSQSVYGDYYNECSGYLGIGRNPVAVSKMRGEDTSAWAFFSQEIQADERIDFMLNTPATRLVTDEAGAVIGVIAESDGQEIAIKANKGVVLGTGGFEHNPQMRAQYLSYPLVALCSAQGNTGDGHRMGMRIGADVAYMDRCWGLPTLYLGEEDPWEMIHAGESVFALGSDIASTDAGNMRGLPGSVIVNEKGRRFGNESASYDTFNRSLGAFDSDTNRHINAKSYMIFDSTYVAPWGLPQQNEDGTLPESYVSADTLEELAEKVGIDVEGFMDEMTRFNEYAAEGLDPMWHRGEHEYDQNTAGYYAAAAGIESGTSNPVLSPLVTPPFYAVAYVPGTFGTCGGLKVDANSQVVNVDGEVIEGLYAVGNCSSGIAGGIYAHGGMTVGSGAVMSWVAVRHMLGIED